MKKVITIIVATLIFNLANAQFFLNFLKSDTLEVNNVKSRIWNNNLYSFDLYQSASHEVPIGSGKHTIFAGSLWIGGKNNNQIHLAAQQYIMGLDLYPGPISDSVHYTSSYDSTWRKIWKISRQDILYHVSNFWQPGYIMPNSILTWPAHGNTALGQSANLAPFADYNNNGIYDPQNGDYPLIRGDECIYFICNDDRGSHNETNCNKLKIEIHGMLYAYNCAQSSLLNDAIFLHYDIYNRSTFTYDSTFIGYFTDFDIGFYADDFVGTHVSKGYIYGYNGNAVDGTGAPYEYGPFPPAQATVFLKGAKQDADGLDNSFGISAGQSVNGYGFSDGIIDNEYRGLDFSFAYYNNGGSYSSAMSTPIACSDYYNYLSNKWKDGTPLHYGGTGHLSNPNTTDTICKFSFPANSDPLGFGTNGIIMPPWDEFSSNNIPFDRRILGSSGPFTFQPGQKQTFDIAFVYARDTINAWPQGSLNLLELRVDSLRQMFLQDNTPCGLSFSGIDKINNVKTLNKLKIYPNPNNGVFRIEFTPHLNEKSIYVYDSVGKLVINKTIESHGNVQVDLSALDNGVYYVKTLNSFGKVVISK